jgi:hypothetical protein
MTMTRVFATPPTFILESGISQRWGISTQAPSNCMSEARPKSLLAEAFASDILDSLQEFWFSHLADKTHVIVPSIQDINVWFINKSDEFDDLCRYVSIAQKISSALIRHCS